MNNRFEFILFDMIGTSIQDSSNGDSLIVDSFSKAFRARGLQIGFKEINQVRGKSKREAIGSILLEHKVNPDLANKIYNEFIALLNEYVNSFTEINGASDVFGLLIEKKIKIGLGSGLPMQFVNKLIEQVGWQRYWFDYIGSSEDIGKGRPDPIMINDAMQKLKLETRDTILKVGDTVVDIQEGKNAGVKTVGVLTGTQSKAELEQQKPDYIIEDIRGIVSII